MGFIIYVCVCIHLHTFIYIHIYKHIYDLVLGPSPCLHLYILPILQGPSILVVEGHMKVTINIQALKSKFQISHQCVISVNIPYLQKGSPAVSKYLLDNVVRIKSSNA